MHEGKGGAILTSHFLRPLTWNGGVFMNKSDSSDQIILKSCPFCGVHPIRGNIENTAAIFLHKEDCFFAPPTFEKPFIVTISQFNKWNSRRIIIDHKTIKEIEDFSFFW